MYASFFGLNEKPFSITPDPRYLFMSERHAEGLAHLIYGVRETGGFIQLTGEVGTGKTTLVRSLLQQVPDSADVALILNPQLSRAEFLSAICEELGIVVNANNSSTKAQTSALNNFLLRNHGKGRKTILIVDEAQNLKVDVLEQVRLLTNLETAKQKLLQIILIGQPELRELLSRNDMRQLAQRITGRYHLEPLSRDDADAYIDHRLKVAGAVGEIFTKSAKRELYKLSGGVPRVINVVADRALLGGFTQELHQITRPLVRSAAREVYDRGSFWQRPWLRWAAMASAAAVVVGLVAWLAVRPTAPASERVAQASPTLSVVDQDERANDPKALTQTTDSPRLAGLLADNADATSTDVAFETLFDLWNVEFTRGPQRACKQAESFQLFCLFQRGALSVIRGLDRPVILTLRDQDSVQHQVVLSGLGDEHALLVLGEEEHRITLSELSQYWFGEYLLVWRPENGEVKAFFPGMRDPAVKWIRASLSTIQGRPADPLGSELFDEGLEERVREYQRERRLTVDGLVGQQTQIAMNTDLGATNRPRLARLN